MTATTRTTAVSRFRLRLVLAGAAAAAGAGLLTGCSAALPLTPGGQIACPTPGGQIVCPGHPGPTPIVVVPSSFPGSGGPGDGGPGNGGQGNGGGGQDVSADPQSDLHLLSGGGNDGRDAQDMAGWQHYQKQVTSGFVPTDKWNIVDSANGVDISSPLGDAGASLAWATNGVSDISNEQANQIFLNGIRDVHIDAQDDPYSFSGGSRQDTVFSGTTGGVPVHGVISTIVFNDNSTGAHGMEVKAATSRTDLWGRLRHTLQLIANHIAITGQPA